MHLLFNDEKLSRLIVNLFTLTGIQTNICDITGQDVRVFGNQCRFCRMINSTPEGHSRCTECDRSAVEACAQSGKAYKYRCHAGLSEVVVPIFDNGEPVAFITFGQMLDASPRERQWEETSKLLAWYPGNLFELRRAFEELDQCSERRSTAYADILEAVTSYIRLEGIVRSAKLTDKQRLEMYIDQHYMEKIALKKMAVDLGIGTTKLCALAKEISPESSITRLVTRRRIDAAKELLAEERYSVSKISEMVGFSDYNYFTKIFRKFEGVTPTSYRKNNKF